MKRIRLAAVGAAGRDWHRSDSEQTKQKVEWLSPPFQGQGQEPSPLSNWFSSFSNSGSARSDSRSALLRRLVKSREPAFRACRSVSSARPRRLPLSSFEERAAASTRSRATRYSSLGLLDQSLRRSRVSATAGAGRLASRWARARL